MAWRIYQGDPGGEWHHLDTTVRTWREGRQQLAERLEPFRSDKCSDCRQQGTEALDRLLALPRGEEFKAEVDGEAYRLTGLPFTPTETGYMDGPH